MKLKNLYAFTHIFDVRTISKQAFNLNSTMYCLKSAKRLLLIIHTILIYITIPRIFQVTVNPRLFNLNLDLVGVKIMKKNILIYSISSV